MDLYDIIAWGIIIGAIIFLGLILGYMDQQRYMRLINKEREARERGDRFANQIVTGEGLNED